MDWVTKSGTVVEAFGPVISASCVMPGGLLSMKAAQIARKALTAQHKKCGKAPVLTEQDVSVQAVTDHNCTSRIKVNPGSR